MIAALLKWSLGNRLLVIGATLGVVGWGIKALYETPVDAIPDLSENQVIVFVDCPGRSPQEVEDQITRPLSLNLQGLTRVKTVRASSMFGSALATVIFDDKVDPFAARQRVLERLNLIADDLPGGVQPKLGPDATGSGWVYEYYLDVDSREATSLHNSVATVGPLTPSFAKPMESRPALSPSEGEREKTTRASERSEPAGSPREIKEYGFRAESGDRGISRGEDAGAPRNGGGRYDLGELRSLQDNYLRPQLSAVPGVAEVASVGGFVRQFQIEVDSQKMRARGVSLKAVMQAVADSNLNVGGRTIEENGLEFTVRGVGLIQSADDLERTLLVKENGEPVYLKDVARVELGGDFRRGALDVAGQEVVGGIVVMRAGENPRKAIAGVKAKLAQLSSSLPPGVTVKSFYDRSTLIDRSIGTLRTALIEEIIVVTLVHVIFLFHFRSILVVTLPLPASILISFILMRHFGFTSNIMSLSGIAIALGVLVDAAIVMTDNVIRRSQQTGESGARNVLAAARQVGRPIVFAMSIIILAFVPVFALSGPEGKLFHPLAFAKTFAMVGATLLALTTVPVLCAILVRGPFHSEQRNLVMGFFLRLYEPALDIALNRRQTVLTLAGVVLISALSLVPRMGSEFMPPLNEGSLLLMPTFVPGISLSEVKRVMAWQDQVIARFPEVQSAVGKLGRADTATDPAPIEMIETTITLKPESQWRPDMSRNKLISEMTEALRAIPGAVPGFVQPIQGRVLMISTGIRAQLGIKIFGDDLAKLDQAAIQVQRIVQQVRGAIGVAASRTQGKPYLEARVKRDALARFGMTVQDVLSVVEVGLGGKTVTKVPGSYLLGGARPSPGAAASTNFVAPEYPNAWPPPDIAAPGDGRAPPNRFPGSARETPAAAGDLAGHDSSGALPGLQRERIPVQVRLQRSEREDLSRLKALLVTGANGKVIPLGQLVDIVRVEGPNEVASENGQLRAYVQANVSGRDLGGFVQEVRKLVDQKIAPGLAQQGMTLEYGGEYENQLHAARALKIIVPSVLLIIFLLLFQLYGSIREAAHVLLAAPFALSGGLLLQYALGWHFSVAVWVGYIALFGTAIQTAVVMVVYLREAVERKERQLGSPLTHEELISAVKEGARLRLRPKVMTVATIIASLLPIMLSHRTGSEILQPLATPIIGGTISSLAHVLIVTPVLFLATRVKRPIPHAFSSINSCRAPLKSCSMNGVA